MRLNDVDDIDPIYEENVVLFNARPDEATFSDAAFSDKSLVLHSVQQSSSDELVRGSTFDSASGEFTIPGRTTAVFAIVQEQPAEPTPTATQVAVPAIADPTVLLTLAGVIGGFVAVVTMMLALRRKDQ
jgi:hypothetical protein